MGRDQALDRLAPIAHGTWRRPRDHGFQDPENLGRDFERPMIAGLVKGQKELVGETASPRRRAHGCLGAFIARIRGRGMYPAAQVAHGSPRFRSVTTRPDAVGRRRQLVHVAIV